MKLFKLVESSFTDLVAQVMDIRWAEANEGRINKDPIKIGKQIFPSRSLVVNSMVVNTPPYRQNKPGPHLEWYLFDVGFAKWGDYWQLPELYDLADLVESV